MLERGRMRQSIQGAQEGFSPLGQAKEVVCAGCRVKTNERVLQVGRAELCDG